MKESTAKSLVCPIIRRPITMAAISEGTCLGSRCMAWRPVIDGSGALTDKGHCEMIFRDGMEHQTRNEYNR